MRITAWPPVAGTIVGAFGYAVLLLARRDVPPAEDPWLEAFEAEGLRAEFRSVSQEPAKQLILRDAREAFGTPALASCPIRHYQVMNGAVQIVLLPAAGSLPELPQGRHPDFRLKEKGQAVHLCRSGRHLLITPLREQFIPFIGPMKRSAEDVDRLFGAFEAAAERRP